MGVVVLVILNLVLPPAGGQAEAGQDDGGEDLVPYGALSSTVQARLIKAEEEQPLEHYHHPYSLVLAREEMLVELSRPGFAFSDHSHSKFKTKNHNNFCLKVYI